MNFLFTINEAYVAPIETLLFSIFDNLGADNRYYFLYDDITDKSIRNLSLYIKNKCYGKADFIRFPYNDMLVGLPLQGNWSREIYFRLFAPYVFSDISNMVYLDGDTLVMGNLSRMRMLEKDKSYVIGAVENDEQEVNLKRIGLTNHNVYVNSGVLAINMDNWREKCSLNKMVSLLHSWKHLLKFPDQDFINLLWQEDIRLLPRSYNYMISLTERDDSYTVIQKPEICHYVFTKPWLDYFEYGTDGPFIYYMKKSGKEKEALELQRKHKILRMKNKIKNIIKMRH